MNSAAQDHIISVKGPELCGRQKRSERPREAGLGHRPSHLMRLGVFAYPQLVLTSSPESPRNPSGQRKPSGPGGLCCSGQPAAQEPVGVLPRAPFPGFPLGHLARSPLGGQFLQGDVPPHSPAVSACRALFTFPW